MIPPLLKLLDIPWEKARGFLRLDLDTIQSALNVRWAAVFTNNNLLVASTIDGDSTIDSVYVSNQGTDHAPMWDKVNLANGVQGRLAFAHLVEATQPAVLAGRRSASAGDFEQITPGVGLAIHGTSLDVDTARLAGALPSVRDGEDGQDGWPGAPGAAGAAGGLVAWSLLSSFTATSGSNHDFTGLAGYNEIMVTFESVTTVANSILQILVSTDNGSTFKTASGDYVWMSSSMRGNAATEIACADVASAAQLRSGAMVISLFNKTQYKPFYPVGHLSNFTLQGMVTVASALNAIRVQPHVGAATTFNGGTIRVWGR